jgi:AraC family transcriptional regulator
MRIDSDFDVSLPGRKYDLAGSPLVAGTSRRRWRGVVAELRSHRATEAPAFVQTMTEVAIVSSGLATIERRGDQRTQHFAAQAGSFCLCPAGVPVDFLRQEQGSVEVLHIYLEADALPSASTVDWPYRGGLQDVLVTQLGLVIAQELRDETAGGELLLDAMSGALIARISQQQHGGSTPSERTTTRGLDPRRLERVKDFLSSGVESELSLDDIAERACLSRHHFVRAFKLSTEKTPYRYLSDLRIERAKVLLMQADSVDEIAGRLQFANSANFARAFRRSTGVSPTDYRATAKPR